MNFGSGIALHSMKPALNVFLQHRPKLVNYANKLIGCPHQAEDVVQEAFVKFDEASNNDVFDNPVAYLYRIVRNLAIDSLRIRTRENVIFCPVIDNENIADSASSPERIALYKNELELMNEALNELPERTRQAIILHRIHGVKIRELAEILGISIGLASTLVCDGVEHCRSKLHR